MSVSECECAWKAKGRGMENGTELYCLMVPVSPAYLCPLFDPGGAVPVVAYFRHSIIVVLPQPFAPTIMVRGLKNWHGWVHGVAMIGWYGGDVTRDGGSEIARWYQSQLRGSPLTHLDSLLSCRRKCTDSLDC